MSIIKAIATGALPIGIRQWLRAKQQRLTRWSPVGYVRFGSLRRLQPISRVFGFDRGQCIDRYYIENFLGHHAGDIRGHVLEIGDDAYTRKFGGGRLTKSDVLHLWKDNPKATIVADLTWEGDHIPPNTFDCVICTQTLHFIYDVRAAIHALYHILKPGGVLLATFPGISQISRYDMERWGEYWRFTSLSARRLFEEAFGSAHVAAEAYGNVLAAVAFLHGLSSHELRRQELDFRDPDYELVIAVRAHKEISRVAGS